ncbi:MAG: hypothetical protein ABI045_03175 [Flavobacteriales bacterium]
MPEKNESYMHLTRANTDLILNEINKKPQTPTYRLNANNTQYEELLCNENIRTFSLRTCEKTCTSPYKLRPISRCLPQGPSSITVQNGTDNSKAWIKAFDHIDILWFKKNTWIGSLVFYRIKKLIPFWICYIYQVLI